MVSPERNAIGEALGRIPSGLFIVTVRHGEEVSAFLGSWIMQAAFEPPMLSVAIKNGRPALELLGGGGSFAVNVLPEGDKHLMRHFIRGFAPGAAPYDGVSVEKGITGVEVLPDALAVLECRPTSTTQAGDHLIVLGEVIGGILRNEDARPAVHFRRDGFGY